MVKSSTVGTKVEEPAEGANIQVMQGHNYENKLSLNTDTLALLARCVFFAVPVERLRCEALLP